MGMAAWLNAGLRNRLAAARRLDHRKTSLIWVGFLPEVWVSAFCADLGRISSRAVGVRVWRLNPKINRNFQIFTPCDFIAAITQHIPDKSFQLVRYYGWYSNKMRGQRKKRAEEEKEAEEVDESVEVIDVANHQPRRIPSKKWRDLIKKVWEADPLICPTCQREMRIVSLIDEREVIDLPAVLRLLAQASIALHAGKMLKCLGLWQQGVRVDPQRQSGADPPGGDWVYEPVDQDPFRDYDTEPVLFYANA